MRWFRSRSRLGACLALFALALQLVLSFGHVHVEGFAAGRAAIAQASTAATGNLANQESPALADDYCSVCALIHLAGSLAPAQPPSLPLPTSFHRPWRTAAVEFDLTRPHRVLFGARAPPTA